MKLPQAFTERLHADLGHTEADKLIDCILENNPPVSVRLNPSKNVEMEWDSRVNWSKFGHYLASRISFIEDPQWHAGAYYVQEASSMFLEYICKLIELPTRATILDACAAPGGKSTLLLSQISPLATLISNEVIPSRNAVLRENIMRWGYPNCIVTQNDTSQFAHLNDFFDAVFVDAPCSGEGLFRKDPESIKQWSTDHVQLCQIRQKQILQNLYPSVKPGAYLIYSTCTFNRGENFDAPAFLLQEGFESVPLPIDNFPEIDCLQMHGIHGYAFHPCKVKGEGFFVSVFRKKGTAASPKEIAKTPPAPKLPESDFIECAQSLMPLKIGSISFVMPLNTYQTARSLLNLKITYAGFRAGAVKGTDYVPSGDMAYQIGLKKENINLLELELPEAISYLKRESIKPRPELKKGIYLATFKGNGLGWLKQIGPRFNNILAPELRIKKAL